MTVTSDDIAVALNDDSINVDRAQWAIGRATALCLSIVDPLPDAADVVVERVAIRGYLQTSARQYQLGAADSMIGGQPGMAGGIYLTRNDRADLRRMAGGGGAFAIDVLPAGYALPVASGDLAAVWDSPSWTLP